MTREHAKGDVAVRGPASDLLPRAARPRPHPEAVEVFGDAARRLRRLAGPLAQRLLGGVC